MFLEAQFLVFLVAIGIGIGAGFLFDCYRAARVTLRLGRLGTSIGDLLVWAVLTLVVFGLLLLTNWGEVRWYILLGLSLGALLYHRTFSRRGVAFWKSGFRVAGRVGRVLASPVVFVWRLLTRPFRLGAWSLVRLRAGFKRCAPPPPDDGE